jgi:hypothetical protein
MGMDEMQNNPEAIVEVEKRRDQDHEQAQKLLTRLEGQAHKDI